MPPGESVAGGEGVAVVVGDEDEEVENAGADVVVAEEVGGAVGDADGEAVPDTALDTPLGWIST
jgi:hypothetical protein